MNQILAFFTLLAAIYRVYGDENAQTDSPLSEVQTIEPTRTRYKLLDGIGAMIDATKEEMLKDLENPESEQSRMSIESTYAIPGTEKALLEYVQPGYLIQTYYQNSDCTGKVMGGAFWTLGTCFRDYNNYDDVNNRGNYAYAVVCGNKAAYVYMWYGQSNCTGDPSYMKPVGVEMRKYNSTGKYDPSFPFMHDEFTVKYDGKLTSCRADPFTVGKPGHEVTYDYGYKLHCEKNKNLNYSLPCGTLDVLLYYDYHIDAAECHDQNIFAGDYYPDKTCIPGNFCEGWGLKENCHEHRDIQSFYIDYWKGQLIGYDSGNCTHHKVYVHNMLKNCSSWLQGWVHHWQQFQGCQTYTPTLAPTIPGPTPVPTVAPSQVPTLGPSHHPSNAPHFRPTFQPTFPPTWPGLRAQEISHAKMVGVTVGSILGAACVVGILYAVISSYRSATGYQGGSGNNGDVELN